MKHYCWVLAFLPLYLHSQIPTPPPYVPMGVEDKLKVHVNRVIQPTNFLKSAAGAGIQQLRDTPREWGQGAEGYGKRVGSSVAFGAAKNMVQFAMDSTLHEDPRYFPTGKKSVKERAIYAALQAVRCRTDSGRTRFAYSRVGSALSAGFISNVWEPDRVATVPQAFVRAAESIGLDAGSNVFKEFWPDIKKKLRRK